MRLGRWSTTCVVVLAVGSASACNPAQRAKVAQDEIESGNGAACVEERKTVETAVAAFELLNPDEPVTEASLVGQFMVEPSVLMDITSFGTVVPAPGTACG